MQRKISDAEPVSIFVYKTLADPFSGRISYFKVMSGVLKNDATLQNFTRGTSERLQHIQIMQGKTATAVSDIARRRSRRDRETEGHAHRRHARRQSRADPLPACRICPSRPSPSPSSPRRAPTRTASARRFTEFWKKTRRCVFRATRRPRNFCWRARASSTSRWSSRNSTSATTWT